MTFKLILSSVVALCILPACAGTQPTTQESTTNVSTGQRGEVCARANTPQCMEGLYCRPQQDGGSQCMEGEFAQEGEVCGTFAGIKCSEGLTCAKEGGGEMALDGEGMCQRDASSKTSP